MVFLSMLKEIICSCNNSGQIIVPIPVELTVLRTCSLALETHLHSDSQTGSGWPSPNRRAFSSTALVLDVVVGGAWCDGVLTDPAIMDMPCGRPWDITENGQAQGAQGAQGGAWPTFVVTFPQQDHTTWRD